MVFKFFTGKEGIGYGDFKLFAAFGAWFGILKLPVILLLASLSGTLFGMVMIFLRKITRSTAFPFGPFLIIAVACIVIFPY
jgi:leader peptidase (prepilin peptidase)/N-methyltransferase